MKIKIFLEDSEETDKALEVMDRMATEFRKKGFEGQIDLVRFPDLTCFFKQEAGKDD